MGTKSWNSEVEFHRDYGKGSKQPNLFREGIRDNRAKIKGFILESASSTRDFYNKLGVNGLELEFKNRSKIIRIGSRYANNLEEVSSRR